MHINNSVLMIFWQNSFFILLKGHILQHLSNELLLLVLGQSQVLQA